MLLDASLDLIEAISYCQSEFCSRLYNMQQNLLFVLLNWICFNEQLLKMHLFFLVYFLTSRNVWPPNPPVLTPSWLSSALLHFHLSHPETGSRACLPTPPPVSCRQPSSGRRSESCGCKRMRPFTCGTTAANCWQPESISACFLPSRAWWRCSRRQSTLGKLSLESVCCANETTFTKNVLPRLCWECKVSLWQWINYCFFWLQIHFWYIWHRCWSINVTVIRCKTLSFNCGVKMCRIFSW